jgi:hypothetical protein
MSIYDCMKQQRSDGKVWSPGLYVHAIIIRYM